MDKFAVDLDKVLNDFEYSELTVQTSDATQRYPVAQQPERFVPGPVKHSINNVFRSLDEYLKSDVAGECGEVALVVGDGETGEIKSGYGERKVNSFGSVVNRRSEFARSCEEKEDKEECSSKIDKDVIVGTDGKSGFREDKVEKCESKFGERSKFFDNLNESQVLEECGTAIINSVTLENGKRNTFDESNDKSSESEFEQKTIFTLRSDEGAVLEEHKTRIDSEVTVNNEVRSAFGEHNLKNTEPELNQQSKFSRNSDEQETLGVHTTPIENNFIHENDVRNTFHEHNLKKIESKFEEKCELTNTLNQLEALKDYKTSNTNEVSVRNEAVTTLDEHNLKNFDSKIEQARKYSDIPVELEAVNKRDTPITTDDIVTHEDRNTIDNHDLKIVSTNLDDKCELISKSVECEALEELVPVVKSEETMKSEVRSISDEDNLKISGSEFDTNNESVSCTEELEALEERKIAINDESEVKNIAEEHNLKNEMSKEPRTEVMISHESDSKPEHNLKITKIDSTEEKEETESFHTPNESIPIPTPETTEEQNAIGFDDSFQIDDNELNKYLDELEAEFGEGEEPPHETDTETIERSDGRGFDGDKMAAVKTEHTRPNTLELKEEVESKRDINLIGEPGSTPFNNTNPIDALNPTKTQNEADIDSSSTHSSSEIFTESDGSTTPSTETLNDDYPMPKQQFVEAQQQQHLLPKVQNVEQVRSDTNEGVVNTNEDVGVASSEEAEPQPQQRIEEDSIDIEGSNTVEELSRLNLGGGVASAYGNVYDTTFTAEERALGTKAPIWIPDNETDSCLHCSQKFTVIKRRHHCRACGLVLCSKCCNFKYRLEYLQAEARVCFICRNIMARRDDTPIAPSSRSSSASPSASPSHQPNPNNPMEYCSMVPPMQQASASSSSQTPAVMVPVGVLKRKGSGKGKTNKSVMFCDGIRPGSDLTNLDSDFDYAGGGGGGKWGGEKAESGGATKAGNRNVPTVDAGSRSYIPMAESSLPPTVAFYKSEISYSECGNNANVVEMLKNETLTFAFQRNLYVHVRIIEMDCCVNKTAWCFTTEGLINVGQDEIVIVLEMPKDEETVPKDIFFHINNIYHDAIKGNTVKEFGTSLHESSNFLGSKNHAGFLYIRPTFQCLKKLILPKEQYLIGLLIHRWETPWAKIFPLRLILRLGAEYRYYPSPIISTRHRESVFVEIGHTIINLLADFRNFSYTLPQIRGLTIQMEDKKTTVNIPSNRYDQVMKSINNSSDHILAFGGNFSLKADAHLVCIQDTHSNSENSYSTHAININNQPRRITALSFIVFNGALKPSSGLTAKSSIIEDGLMIQVPPECLEKIRDSLRNMKDLTIRCGCVDAPSYDELVAVTWGEADAGFNVGAVSPIDGRPMTGVPSIRVHNGRDFVDGTGNLLVRWTEVFILQSGEESSRSQDPSDVSKISEAIGKASCLALVKHLYLLSGKGCQKVGVRVTLRGDDVSYVAGSNGKTLKPLYMHSLDEELIPVLHRLSSGGLGDGEIVLELIFRILNV